MSRILLLEHNAPLLTPPSQWKVEMVQPERFAESLIESYVATTEARYKALTEALLNNQSLTEENVRTLLAGFKDEFVRELREAHQHKRLRVSGPAQVENKRNGNGRIYPTALWDRVLSEDSDFSERLRNRQVLGELEHPTEGNTRLPRVSHLVEKVWRSGGVVYAQHLVFRTPNGAIVEELYNAGHCPGVSSRGAGSTRSVNGDDVVEESDFHLDTWDFVAQPSVITARPSRMGENVTSSKTPSVSEGANWLPQTVPSIERHGEQSMTTAVIVESSQTLANANVVLQNSSALLEGKPKLSDLLKMQQTVVETLSAIGSRSIPAELSEGFNSTRARLAERADTLRREIGRRVNEEDDNGGEGDNDDKKPVPPQFQQQNGGGDGGGDGDNGDDKGDKTERLIKLIRSEGFQSSKMADLMVEMAERIVTLRQQTEGHVSEEKYRTAIQLGEAVVARANNDRKVFETKISELNKALTESRKAQAAHHELLTATVDRYRTEQVESAVDGFIADNPRLKGIEKRLRECRDMGELNSLVKSTVQPLVEGAPPKARPELPLPPLTEGAKPRRGSTNSAPTSQPQTGGSLMEMLTEGERTGYPRV